VPGPDDWAQGAGSGHVVDCERADLKVTVTGPASAPDGLVRFTVKVENLGPDGTPYALELDEEMADAAGDKDTARTALTGD
jgi:hypothetical protein